MSLSAEVSWPPATKFILSGTTTVWIAVEPPLRGSPPAIVIGYVTPLVGSVYWKDQCGMVRALARNCPATPPGDENSAATSGLACGLDPTEAAPVTSAATTSR